MKRNWRQGASIFHYTRLGLFIGTVDLHGLGGSGHIDNGLSQDYLTKCKTSKSLEVR